MRPAGGSTEVPPAPLDLLSTTVTRKTKGHTGKMSRRTRNNYNHQQYYDNNGTTTTTSSNNRNDDNNNLCVEQGCGGSRLQSMICTPTLQLPRLLIQETLFDKSPGLEASTCTY